MNNYKVYKFTTPSNKIYIGVTRQDVERRWRKGRAYKTNSYLTYAINKYGWDNITKEVLFNNLSYDEASQREKELIKLYKSDQREFGYNIDYGGIANSREVSNETRKKLSDINIGVNKGFKSPVAKKVFQYDIQGNFIKTWYSISDAMRSTGVKAIDRCCSGRYTTAGGYIWLYDNNIEDRLKQVHKVHDLHLNSITREVAQYTLDGKLIKIYPTITEAAKVLNSKLNKNLMTVRRCISASCEGGQSSAYKYIWLYKESSIQDRLESIKNNKYNKIVGCQSKIVEQYTLDGEFVAKYNSLVDACKVLGINKKKSNGICRCCYGQQGSAYGYKWKYITE